MRFLCVEGRIPQANQFRAAPAQIPRSPPSTPPIEWCPLSRGALFQNYVQVWVGLREA